MIKQLLAKFGYVPKDECDKRVAHEVELRHLVRQDYQKELNRERLKYAALKKENQNIRATTLRHIDGGHTYVYEDENYRVQIDLTRDFANAITIENKLAIATKAEGMLESLQSHRISHD